VLEATAQRGHRAWLNGGSGLRDPLRAVVIDGDGVRLMSWTAVEPQVDDDTPVN